MRKQTKLWTTKSGEKIRICDMTDIHLSLTIKYLQRQAEDIRKLLLKNAHNTDIWIQGEISSDIIDRQIRHFESDEFNPAELFPIYNNLLEEATQRELI